jgi:hypothetical protein
MKIALRPSRGTCPFPPLMTCHVTMTQRAKAEKAQFAA